MGKLLFVLCLCLIPIHVNASDIECLGFLPAVALICSDDGAVSKVEGFEEKRCGEGRDGVLNEDIAIFSVAAPAWYGPDERAEVSFITAAGDPVTFTDCRVTD